jgi:hypothetical protein
MTNEVRDRATQYLSELQSIRCGVRQGWYAVDQDGNLASGPFATRASCLEGMPPLAEPPAAQPPAALHAIEDGAFSYTIQVQRFKTGKLVWIWEVRKVGTRSIVDRGASVRSRDGAITAALGAISAAQATDRAHGPAPW